MIYFIDHAAMTLAFGGAQMHDSRVCKVDPDCKYVIEKYYEVDYYLICYF